MLIQEHLFIGAHFPGLLFTSYDHGSSNGFHSVVLSVIRLRFLCICDNIYSRLRGKYDEFSANKQNKNKKFCRITA